MKTVHYYRRMAPPATGKPIGRWQALCGETGEVAAHVVEDLDRTTCEECRGVFLADRRDIRDMEKVLDEWRGREIEKDHGEMRWRVYHDLNIYGESPHHTDFRTIEEAAGFAAHKAETGTSGPHPLYSGAMHGLPPGTDQKKLEEEGA